jgi:hypothetical protein
MTGKENRTLLLPRVRIEWAACEAAAAHCAAPHRSAQFGDDLVFLCQLFGWDQVAFHGLAVEG